MTFKRKLLSLAAALPAAALLTAAPADAHRRWLLPSATVLSGDSELVTVDAAASNGLFLFEHRPLGLDSLTIVGPDGQPVEPKVIGSGDYRSVFDLPLTQQGTYRIALANDGVMGFYMLNGERQRWRGSRAEIETAIPAEATEVRISENAGRTETFVTLGAPSDDALQPTQRGLEMIPVTHPNDLVTGEPAQMRFLHNGQPAANMEVEFVKGGTRYRDTPGVQTLTTDADGMVELLVEEPGYYYVEAGTQSDAADDPQIDSRRASYTAVLEFLPL
ncbi:hypothetical protein B5C34_15405 [Pacificimonas flava]|uniref:DUF4198 domain-containing protein n=2 Tax=Pacificimonas TaxID=1960290 RepID=A0A219B0N5_9SPHN|nr:MULTISPECIES: DUF4198 domain-containing protein [Pacificimonas]MBZ6379649.1 DUF4198 domain-containing protein [Pacificimonas aurantium]OWV31885.1 hypothetical protein B5C34_15405 [Pacificimonas flava]